MRTLRKRARLATEAFPLKEIDALTQALISHRRLGLTLAFTTLVVDQIVKYIVTGPLGIDGIGKSIEILPIFNLTFVANYGVSMGMLRASSEATRWGLVALTAAISIGVVWWMWLEKKRWDVLALGLVLGGALGNIVDRVRFGHVIDYADLHFGDFRPFLIFNVADAAITIGVLILLARALIVRDKPDVTETVDA